MTKFHTLAAVALGAGLSGATPAGPGDVVVSTHEPGTMALAGTALPLLGLGYVRRRVRVA